MTARAWIADRLVTCALEFATKGNELGVIDRGVLVTESGRCTYVGPEHGAPISATDCMQASVITPGLLDAHTHACWVGSRHDEYVLRMAGADYREIAARGGGIVASSCALESTLLDDIAYTLYRRLCRMASLGVTTVEVKSGYGLLPELEERQLQAIRMASEMPNAPHVIPTFLGLHAIPPAYLRRRDDYIAEVVNTVLPRVAPLARFVDAYVDANAFAPDEARLLAQGGMAKNLGVRLHVGQFADVGGAELAAELGASSVDHMEHVSDIGISALASAGVPIALLPTASFTLGQAAPNIAAFRRANIALIVASDANPGTAPSESLPLAMALAMRLYALRPEEIWLGVTRFAALSLGEPNRGALHVGNFADYVVWDAPHEHALLQPWGVSRARYVAREGVALHGVLSAG